MEKIEQEIIKLNNRITLATGYKYRNYLTDKEARTLCLKSTNLLEAMSIWTLKTGIRPKKNILKMAENIKSYVC